MTAAGAILRVVHGRGHGGRGGASSSGGSSGGGSGGLLAKHGSNGEAAGGSAFDCGASDIGRSRATATQACGQS